MQGDLAPYSTIRTGGVYFVELPAAAFAHGLLINQGTGGAQLDALATLHTTRLAHGKIVVADDLGVVTPESKIQHLIANDLRAPGNTAATLDTFRVVTGDELSAIVNVYCRFHSKRRSFNTQFIGGILQFAIAVFLAGEAIMPTRGQQQVNDQTPGRADGIGISLYDEAVLYFNRAGRLQATHAFHLNEAESALSGGAGMGVVAQGGDVDAVLTRRLKEGLARLHLKNPAIHGNLHFVFPFRRTALNLHTL
jgi:hypothetical protein